MNKKLNCVLLVDDNDSDNYIHKRVIAQSGITDFIGIAENGKEALEFLTTKRSAEHSGEDFPRPELIFVDINMPIMNGWEFLAEYQKLDDIQKGHLLIIMLTTSLSTSDVTKTEKMLGRDCFLYKPLTSEMLDDILRKYFPEYL
jgi:CheY-like chemotaxis protein